MALSETDTSDANTDTSAECVKQNERKERMLTKVIMRRLPPSMTKESLLSHISPLPDYDYMYFVKADMSLGEHAYARAYINFKNPEDIYIFKERFDNYVFLDAKGNEYPAVVEFAPFSHIPKRRTKKGNPKCGTIESDPAYIEFVESLKKVPSEVEEKPEFCLQPSVEEDKNVQNTPLLEYVKQKRLDRQKLKEEKREERKRREMERKKLKEEERKGRKRMEHVNHNHTITKISTNPAKHTLTSNLDATEISKTDPPSKSKDKKNDEYRMKGGGKLVKEYVDKRTSYTSTKDIHRLVDQKKSPSKIRQRNMVEKESRRIDYKSKRDECVNKKRDDKDEKIEKKVKKYSERREERKNEIKKQELKTDTENNMNTETDQIKLDVNKTNKENKLNIETKSGTASSEIKISSEFSEKSDTSTENKDNAEEVAKYQNEKLELQKDYGKNDKDHDPRAPRRIKNKDRPTMAIYQPGMGLNRNRKLTDPSEEGQKLAANNSPTKQEVCE